MTQAISTEIRFFINLTGNLFSMAPQSKAVSVEAAVDGAFAIFASSHPEWVERLFDQHFIDQRVKPVVKINHQRGRNITAVDVAMMWDAQFAGQSIERRQQNMDELIAVTRLFARELAARLV